MGLFSSPEEVERKANLKKLEDKRLAFAQAMANKGFKPEAMLMAQADNGGLIAACRYDGARWLVVGPALGTEDDFDLVRFEPADVRTRTVEVKAEGMGGMFGFGKKGQQGVEYTVVLSDGREVVVPFVYGRNSAQDFDYAHNPLLKAKRRRGDANVVWDLRPLEASTISRTLELAAEYFVK